MSRAVNVSTAWEDDALKIKLKIAETESEIKPGIYYPPLSAAPNQKQVEEGPADVSGSSIRQRARLLGPPF